MAKEKDSLHEKLVDIIERQGTECNRDNITASASLVDDLGFDSLDCIELVMEIEEQFHVQIDDAIASEWKTVGDVETWLKKTPCSWQS